AWTVSLHVRHHWPSQGGGLFTRTSLGRRAVAEGHFAVHAEAWLADSARHAISAWRLTAHLCLVRSRWRSRADGRCRSRTHRAATGASGTRRNLRAADSDRETVRCLQRASFPRGSLPFHRDTAAAARTVCQGSCDVWSG